MTSSYNISTDKSLLDLDVIHQFLSRDSYWAKNIPLEVVQKSIENSLCFGVYDINQQVGFARVITDYATIAYLSDVFILPNHRGYGLSKKLIQFITEYPNLQKLRRWLLITRDAQALYQKFGFVNPEDPSLFMHRKLISSY